MAEKPGTSAPSVERGDGPRETAAAREARIAGEERRALLAKSDEERDAWVEEQAGADRDLDEAVARRLAPAPAAADSDGTGRAAETPRETSDGDAPEHRLEVAAAKAELDAAYASGDEEKLAAALREALAAVEGRPEPERQTTWETIANERGGVVESFPNYEAAKRALGVVPGTEIHHIVEQAQAKPERSGFDLSRINSTDNLTRIPPDVHRKISAEYSRNVPYLGVPRRDTMDERPWEAQYAAGAKMLDRLFRERSS